MQRTRDGPGATFSVEVLPLLVHQDDAADA
jgi:hypothetical protein